MMRTLLRWPSEIGYKKHSGEVRQTVSAIHATMLPEAFLLERSRQDWQAYNGFLDALARSIPLIKGSFFQS